MTRDERYEAEKRAWIAEQLKNCPPPTERQKQLIRTAFAAHRREKGKAA
jgi:hypothetical protein